MDRLATAVLLVMALMCLYPAIGVISGAMLERLYGTSMHDRDLLILMRHRAVLFGCVGVFLACAAFMPALRIAGLFTGAVVLGSYVLLALATGGYNATLGKLVVPDAIATTVALATAVALLLRDAPPPS